MPGSPVPAGQQSHTPAESRALPSLLPEVARRQARYRRLIPDLRPGERVVMLRRRHPMTLVSKLFWPVALVLLWLASLFFVLEWLSGLSAAPASLEGGLPAWVPQALWLLWLGLLGWLVLWTAYRVLDWSDDWLALTTRRLIIMDKKLFLRETRREIPILQIQNVSIDYRDATATALDFGDLAVDTAGLGLIAYSGLPHPGQLREAIFAQQQALRAAQPPAEDRRKAAVRALIRHNQAGLGGAPPTGGATPPQESAPTDSRRGPLNGYFAFGTVRGPGGLLWRRHWVFWLRGFVGPALLLAVAAVALYIAVLTQDSESPLLSPGLFAWGVAFLAPVCLVWAFWNWENWRNDRYSLDRERVYHVESLPFGLRERSSETLITRITDVTYVVPGPLANLLDFGDVVIQTPGESTDFAFKGIPHPRQVQQAIMARLDAYRQKAGTSVDHEIEAWLQAYHDVMKEGKRQA